MSMEIGYFLGKNGVYLSCVKTRADEDIPIIQEEIHYWERMSGCFELIRLVYDTQIYKIIA